jgi:4-methyl-5(b-hydroxyethyl)-thiazole monophosphate biosynthesis
MPEVLVLLAKGFEEIEAVTVVDVLRRSGVRVTTAAIHEREVPGSRGITVLADVRLADIDARSFDLVFLPGGAEGMERLAADPRVGDALRAHAERGGRLAAICAGTFALHAHGLIPAGARITSHPSVAEDLARFDYVEDRVVVDGTLITSRGPGTAMELALALVELLVGAAKRSELETAMLTPAGNGR